MVPFGKTEPVLVIVIKPSVPPQRPANCLSYPLSVKKIVVPGRISSKQTKAIWSVPEPISVLTAIIAKSPLWSCVIAKIS